MTDVYVATIPNEIGKEPLFPAERQAEVLSCAHARVQRQKYYAWRLLEYALRNSFGLDIKDLVFCKNKNGKWTAEGCYFSISHSHDAVAVGVSDGEIGVDVERLNGAKNDFLQTVLTERERAEFCTIAPQDQTEYLIEKWTKKESVFKRAGDGIFRPSKMNADDGAAETKKVVVGGEEYMLSVAADELTAGALATGALVTVRYFFDVALG